jgi:6-phospho-3-hexuloisomerase
VFVRVPVQTKLNLPGELASRQLLSSLFEQCLLVLGDAVCLRLAELKGLAAGSAGWGKHANLE